MKSKIISFVALAALVFGLGGSMVTNTSKTEAAPGQFGGAAGLIAAVVQVQDVSVVAYDVVDINNNKVLNNSLNHLNVEVLTGNRDRRFLERNLRGLWHRYS